jgi:hypothetical protein
MRSFVLAVTGACFLTVLATGCSNSLMGASRLTHINKRSDKPSGAAPLAPVVAPPGPPPFGK